MSVLDEAVAAIRSRSSLRPRVGVVLGSGLGAWGDALLDVVKIPYANIPGMPAPAVVGHPGNLCLGYVGEVPVACLQGRVHLYEGHPQHRVVFGVRVLSELQCDAVLLTNAAGGVNTTFAPGDLMLLTDHLNLMGTNPLVGPNDDKLGKRFPDMTYAHNPDLLAAAREAASEIGIELREGVYAGNLGPMYETPAEIRMMRLLGADAVGMSTVPEIIALRHMNVPAAAISCITNLAAGLTRAELDHTEVEEIARRTRARFGDLLSAWTRRVAMVKWEPRR